MYELINVLPPSNFAVFNCSYFLCYWLQRAETCTTCINEPALLILNLIGMQGYIFYGLTLMLMSKNVNNDVMMNPSIYFTFFIVLGQCKIPKRFLESFVSLFFCSVFIFCSEICQVNNYKRRALYLLIVKDVIYD